MTTNVDQLKKQANDYFNAMMDAHASGGNIADHIDLAGMEALTKITGSARGIMNYGMDASFQSRMSGFVPTVIERDETGRPAAYDLFSRLMKDRIVLLQGGVDQTMAAIACASLLFLAHIDKDGNPTPSSTDPISVYIDSPGGSVIAGQAIYDVMRSIEAPVVTIGMGMQASMGSILLAAGDERKMTRSSKLMIHSIGSGTEGKLADQEISLEVTRRLFDEMKAVYTRHIGLTPEYWDLICSRDTWLTAEQALKMGFIDQIIVGDRKPAPYEKAAADFLEAAQKKRDAQVPDSIQEIKELLINKSSDEGKGERLRAELLVALAQKPEFWTEGLKAKKAAQAAQAAAANQNDKAAATVKTPKQAGGPTA